MRSEYVTEVISRTDDEYYCGTSTKRRGRIVFEYHDMSQSVWSRKYRTFAPKEVTTSYPDVFEFSKDWHIISQMPLN